MAPESTTKLLVLPALALLGIVYLYFKTHSNWNWFNVLAGSVGSACLIFGYLAGAYFADNNGAIAICGVVVAFFAPIIAFMLVAFTVLVASNVKMKKK
eukprot:gnl/MRDRNA2_/MRDRNA2_143963_c0_seq1.p1 gnl/MRDRNA2_/MRDRNA2_143963_c0~~gnl/MRDRNA2_/MRDRNA2_143963_c0_seq1.p1  ORF type:complete len:115 (+),score=21.86 gnl/MRDRNA2_/MRDRNA2_143963_c0_seq1:53-346(+)